MCGIGILVFLRLLCRCGYIVGKSVLVGELCHLCIEFRTLFLLDVVQIFVGVELVGVAEKLVNGDVAAVVGDTLQAGADIGQGEAQVDGALPVLQAYAVAALDLHIQAVHNLLQGLYHAGKLLVAGFEGLDGDAGNLVDCTAEDIQLSLGGRRKGDFPVCHIPGDFRDIQSVVAEAFQITDGPLQNREKL